MPPTPHSPTGIPTILRREWILWIGRTTCWYGNVAAYCNTLRETSVAKAAKIGR